MSRKIEDISIFGEYKSLENRVTAAFLQICKIGGDSFVRYISQILGFQLPENEISISAQAKEEESKPDGLLESNFSFKLYIESKVKENAINKRQLENHKKLIINNNNNVYLVYLTPDKTKPNELSEIYWANWMQISEAFNSYIAKNQSSELFEFLIEHFKILLDNNGLIDTIWDINNNRVLIVAASSAEDIAIKYNVYVCQNRRSFRPSKYIAFYNDNSIRYLFQILEPPKDDCSIKELPKELIEWKYDVDKKYKVFKIKKDCDVGPIRNDSIDKNGNPCPFTYGQPRYTTIEHIQRATRTSQLVIS